MLLKDIFQAFGEGNQAKWEELEKPFRAYFEVTHKDELKGEIDIPPAWAYTWYDWVAKGGPASAKGLANSPALH